MLAKITFDKNQMIFQELYPTKYYLTRINCDLLSFPQTPTPPMLMKTLCLYMWVKLMTQETFIHSRLATQDTLGKEINVDGTSSKCFQRSWWNHFTIYPNQWNMTHVNMLTM